MSAVLNRYATHTCEPAEASASEIAQSMLDRYGVEAPLQAALSARGAVDAGDPEACMFWRDVLDLLCARVMPPGYSQ